MTGTSETFKVRINGGRVRDFTTGTGKYMYAAMAAVLEHDALLPLPDREESAIHVEIWCERLMPKYGPYHFLIWEDAHYSGHLYVVTAVPRAHEPAPVSQGPLRAERATTPIDMERGNE